ncbi:type II toxin-antitoxin system RelE/ParE family toxin [Weissella cibaria]
MEKFEFDYYDWAEFEQFLDQLPDKDAAKLIATIQRALYFQVKGSQYIITNAFTKKTQKTPENEKQIARNRRSQYLNKEENK